MNDTIAAIATALSPSGIGIIRISGPNALLIAKELYTGKNVGELSPNTINYGHIKHDGRLLDEVLLSYFKGPHSYTGEDVIEINCHGGVLALKNILGAVISCGARPAEPGEFTKRAYLNGRMDLSGAEAVMDVISAKSEYALQSAVSQLGGSLNEKISSVRDALLYELAYIESALDDPEHISLDGYGERLLEAVRSEREKLCKLAKTAEKGRYIEEGIRTVILGKPNVGKSSLLNLLIGRQRAIVTDIPGTTRDVLEETISFGSIALRIIDTAGIHASTDKVEKIGIERAWEAADGADLILYVIDGTDAIDDDDKKILKKLSHKRGIVLLNKSDLGMKVTADDAAKLTDFPVIEVSAKNGYGEDELKALIEKLFIGGEISFNDEVFITNMRHKALIDEAINSLTLVEDSIQNGMPEDFYSIDLAGAIGSLNNIIGGDLSEDLVDEIFSKFCTGK